ncbi:MAG: type III-B CRISPR module RAMP protein Cmr4 [Lachnospiraceae bacterium]|nr:type III-B CRISPR module RAMP protein Cmr4 [Lachnospiraceae bacterium]
MYKNADLMIMRAMTPVHAGCGSDLGIIDLQIQREKHTNFPKIESSGIKGCIREACEEIAASKEDVYNIHNIFGYDKDSKNCYYSVSGGMVDISAEVKLSFKKKEQFAGAIGFTDGKILLFPVISACGVFAYATCEMVLKRFFEEAAFSDCGFEQTKRFRPENDGEVWCSSLCELKMEDRIIVEEYTYTPKTNEHIEVLIKKLSQFTGLEEGLLMEKLIIVSDDDFKDFVTMNTEVITRTKIDNITGAVADGALFTEEYLPVETIMYSTVMYSAVFSQVSFEGGQNQQGGISCCTAAEVKQAFRKMVSECPIIQLGSGATIGKGIVKVSYRSGEEM